MNPTQLKNQLLFSFKMINGNRKALSEADTDLNHHLPEKGCYRCFVIEMVVKYSSLHFILHKLLPVGLARLAGECDGLSPEI